MIPTLPPDEMRTDEAAASGDEQIHGAHLVSKIAHPKGEKLRFKTSSNLGSLLPTF
jgi:hypothetical protein